MAKKTKKRQSRQENDQAGGCMWSLINIFDFRHGRSSQKLLLDKKRGSRRIDGAAYDNIKLESLADSCQICHENNDAVQSEAITVDTGKLSVKELMEEEMCGEQDQKRQGTIPSGDVKQTATGGGGHIKNRRRMRNKMSLDLEADGFVPAEGLVAERPNHRKHKSCSSLDLNEMVEQMCSRIYQKDINKLKHGEDCENSINPSGLFKASGDSSTEKRLVEATKVLVRHFTDVKSNAKDGKVQPSKELTDALQILNSNKELFLKLLQDPSSQLVKHIQSLQDIQIEEGKFKVLTGSVWLEREIGNAKQPSFFWRRFKSHDKSSSKKSDTSEDLSRIVVLKPGPLSSRNSDTASTCSSLSESPLHTRDKGHIEKTSFPFSFAEIKRRLKHAMRKDQHGLSHQPSDGQLNMANRDKKLGGETFPVASPSRDHFFIEKIPKSSGGNKKVDKTGKLKEGKMLLEHTDAALTSDQRASSIYEEAKKHLAEIVGNTDVDVETFGRKVPKSLGKILAYSGYDSPTIYSPRKDGESPNVKCQGQDANKSDFVQDINVSPLVQMKLETESELCVASNEAISEDDTPILESHDSFGLPDKCDTDKPIQTCELPSPEDIARFLVPSSDKESSLLEISMGPHSPEPITKAQQDSCEENEQSSCPESPTLDFSANEKTEELDCMSDATSRPSPISVLEPIFKEDDISPPGVKYFIAIEPIRPRQIKFEEEIKAPLGRVPRSRICVDDDKYTFDFVKAVVQMSGLTWDELLRRSLFSDHLIDPSLIDEVDFLPDLLPCDFNLLFDLINEVVTELCWLNIGCMLSLAMRSDQRDMKRKDIFNETWKRVDWFLKFEGPPPTLDQIVAKDFAKPGKWADIQFDRENIGIQLQEAILDELLKEIILSGFSGSQESQTLFLPPAEEKNSESIEL